MTKIMNTRDNAKAKKVSAPPIVPFGPSNLTSFFTAQEVNCNVSRESRVIEANQELCWQRYSLKPQGNKVADCTSAGKIGQAEETSSNMAEIWRAGFPLSQNPEGCDACHAVFSKS